MNKKARITVCEVPNAPISWEESWHQIAAHCRNEGTDFLVLPEFAFLEAIWESQTYSESAWAEAQNQSSQLVSRLEDLMAPYVLGTLAMSKAGARLNQGFLWSSTEGAEFLRAKYYLPNEEGSWEGNWFSRGDRAFPVFTAGQLKFGLNICTELWALDSPSMYRTNGAHAVICPRATAGSSLERWFNLACTVAARYGLFCISSNRQSTDGTYGGGGWIISPDGEVLAKTSKDRPVATAEVDLYSVNHAQLTYPRNVFR